MKVDLMKMKTIKIVDEQGRYIDEFELHSICVNTMHDKTKVLELRKITKKKTIN